MVPDAVTSAWPERPGSGDRSRRSADTDEEEQSRSPVKCRVILLTGKGGVGKTTVAAATALRAAEMGHRVLVMSADPAHSLGDVFDRELGPEPQELRPNLHAQEIDVYHSIQKYWGTLRDYTLQVLRWQKVDDMMAEEMAALPGMEEAATFLWVDKFHREGDFDLIIIDSAPTSKTLTLLSLPMVGQWWAERVFPLPRMMAKAVGPIIRAVTGAPTPESGAAEEAEDLYQKLLDIHAVLTDPESTSVRLVLNPERMVVREARRAYTYLQLYGYPVDAVIVNRVLPETAGDHFVGYLEAQEGYLKEIDEAFAPLPIFRVPHLGREVVGEEPLLEVGRRLFGETDPSRSLYAEKPYRLTPQDGAYLLEIHLPFMESGDVSVLQKGDELVVQVKAQRRNFFLPKFLGFYTAKEARLKDGWLRVRFEKAGAPEQASAGG